MDEVAEVIVEVEVVIEVVVVVVVVEVEVEVGLTGLGKGSSQTLQWRPPSRSPPSILLPLLNITAMT